MRLGRYEGQAPSVDPLAKPNGGIALTGAFATGPGDAFDATTGIGVRVQAGGALDRTFAWSSSECDPTASGKVTCQTPDPREQATFRPIPRAAGQYGYDLVHERTHDGRPLRILTVVDEYTRECLAIRVSRRLCSEDVLQQLTDLFVARGTPQYLRSDNGPEPTATAVREWLAHGGVTTLFIEPGSPWENG
jgi:hypothetical protein